MLVTHPQTRQPHHGHGPDLYPGPALPWEKRLILLPSRDIDELETKLKETFTASWWLGSVAVLGLEARRLQLASWN